MRIKPIAGAVIVIAVLVTIVIALLLHGIDGFFGGVEWFYNNLFITLPESMRVLAFSIVMATVSYCAARRPGGRWKLARLLVILFVMAWAAWKAGAIRFLAVEDQIIQTVGLVLVIVIIVFKFYLYRLKFKGVHVFRYWTLWVFYTIALVFFMVMEPRAEIIVHSLVFFVIIVIVIGLNRSLQPQTVEVACQ